MNISFIDYWVDEELNQLGSDFAGVNPLGISHLPYYLGAEYEDLDNPHRRYVFDLMETANTYYICRVAEDDTGRIIRIQLKEDGIPIVIDTDDDEIQWKVYEGENTIINWTDIISYTTEAQSGILELPLSSTITGSDCNIMFRYNYKIFLKQIRIIADDKATITEAGLTPILAIPQNSRSRTLTFFIYDYNHNLIDIENISSATFNMQQFQGIKSVSGAMVKGDNCLQYTIQSYDMDTKGTFAISISITTYTSKLVKIPTTGHISLEVV